MAMKRLLQGARGELVPQPFEAAPDAPVNQPIADPHDDAAEQVLDRPKSRGRRYSPSALRGGT